MKPQKEDAMHTYIDRPHYLEQMKRLKDTQIIKVVTGLRHSGKATLFALYIEYLHSIGVPESQIIHINLENPVYHPLSDFMDLYTMVDSLITNKQMYYVFIDEVQQVSEFERAVSGLQIKKNVDLYLTGSNAFLLSGELATLLAGRYVEIKMLPLSFSEYRHAVQTPPDLPSLYRQYVSYGSLPYIPKLKTSHDILLYLEGVYSSIVMKDIVARNAIREVGLLEDIIRFMAGNISSFTSPAKIANTLTAGGRTISAVTVESYLASLVNGFFLYKVGRWDVKGRRHLVTGSKYYISELGLRRYLLGQQVADHGHILENVVFLELLRRGHEVYIGYQSDGEVDFVTFKDGEQVYWQVAYTAIDSATLERELKPLLAIKDHWPKVLLTMDMVPPAFHEGVRQLNVLDWLIEG